MKKLLYKIGIISQLVLLCNCASNTKNNTDIVEKSNVERVTFKYMPYGEETMIAIETYEEILNNDDLIDTTLTDADTIQKFMNMVNNLDVWDNAPSYLDLRVAAEIYYKDGCMRHICFGEEGDILTKEGIRMKDSKELFEFLDRVLYSKIYYRKLYDNVLSQYQDRLPEFANSPESEELFERLYKQFIIDRDNDFSNMFFELRDALDEKAELSE